MLAITGLLLDANYYAQGIEIHKSATSHKFTPDDKALAEQFKATLVVHYVLYLDMMQHWQARQDIHRNSVNRSANYQKFLADYIGRYPGLLVEAGFNTHMTLPNVIRLFRGSVEFPPCIYCGDLNIAIEPN